MIMDINPMISLEEELPLMTIGQRWVIRTICSAEDKSLADNHIAEEATQEKHDSVTILPLPAAGQRVENKDASDLVMRRTHGNNDIDRHVKKYKKNPHNAMKSDVDGLEEKKRVGPPMEKDWEKAQVFVNFLKKFHDTTLQLSATKKTTSLLIWEEIVAMRIDIDETILDTTDPSLQEVAKRMESKFKKYWGNLEKVNKLVFLGHILDPHYKLQMIGIQREITKRYLSFYDFIVILVEKVDGAVIHAFAEKLLKLKKCADASHSESFYGLSEGADANSQRRDQLALGQIHQGVDYSIFGLIANAKTAKEAWDTLKLSYKGVDRAQKSKLQSLRRLYDRCEMSSTETVEHYFSRLTDLVNKMRLYGDKIGDDAVVEKILRTIPLKYDHVVASIQESHDIELLTIAELKGMIESHIDRIEAKTETPANEEALKSQFAYHRIEELVACAKIEDVLRSLTQKDEDDARATQYFVQT
ncbi:hypothetical protein ZIOFF_039306 [Zingiber officinale]|uniref:hAT-like transposase RNase-H fold domain-containing protein n=1 Tax=Zingiber officinale TaxID=94328 RepID=A0A8J5GFS3_ZINOF|nr:hypothetical protein ZIOFF_039306 [Zingiber officinale]